MEIRIPPHNCTPAWFDRLIDSIRELNPPKITREFVAANVVGSRNEGKVLTALEFLGLVDANGNVTSRLLALRAIGPEFTANLAIVVRQAYAELLSTISMKSATHDRLISFLMTKYSLGQSQAEGALRFFVCLASRAGMEMSDELTRPTQLRQEGAVKVKHILGATFAKKPKPAPDLRADEGEALATIDGSFGRIRIVDQSTLELARKLLDLIEEKIKNKRE